MALGEPSTSTDVETVDNPSSELVSDDRLRPLVAAWLLGFKSPHTVRSYRNNLTHWLAFCDEHQLAPWQRAGHTLMPGPGSRRWASRTARSAGVYRRCPAGISTWCTTACWRHPPPSMSAAPRSATKA
jgi:hypothetical protein